MGNIVRGEVQLVRVGDLTGMVKEVNCSIDGGMEVTLGCSQLDGYSYTRSFLDEISVSGTLNKLPKIKKVIFNNPATIVLWCDGTKTVVKYDEKFLLYNKEKGLAMCIAKKALGNKGNYYNTFKKWLGE